MKRVWVLGALLALVLVCAPAHALKRLPKYALVVSGERVALSEKTGYLFRSGTKLMIPVETVAKALDLSVHDSTKAALSVTRADGTVIKIANGTKTMLVDGKKQALRVTTGRQDGQILTADVKILSALGFRFKHYKAGSETRGKGYPAGVLVVAKPDGEITLPSVVPEPPADVLPAALKEAAKTATQIVGVAYQGGSKAKVTFYQKGANGAWEAAYSTNGFVGSNGIDKVREGDKKTPTGTFNLTTPFGILANPGTTLGDYVKVTKYHYWSGANDPARYNRLIDTRVDKTYKPTSRDEHLIDYKGVYNYACFIDYNSEGVVGKGSAIFLHCTGKNSYTGGCVAVPESVMKALLKTLKPGAKIVIYR